MKPGLAALIHPLPLAEFATHLEANEPLVVHGLGKTIEPLTRLPFLASLEAMLNSWPKPVQAHLPEVADEASSIDASPADARKLFDSGMGLLFDEAQESSAELRTWLEAIRRDAGLSQLTRCRSLVYATPKGKGTAAHFDQNVNFVLQLHGTKTWRLEPNRQVENPLTRHTLGLPADPELQTYAREPWPARMPAGARSIVLEKGSLLFVPRGVWHSTQAQSDALSLNFTYSAPAWLDLFTAALRSRLALSSEWRETAFPSSPEKLEALLQQLAYDVPNWRAEDILAATEGSN